MMMNRSVFPNDLNPPVATLGEVRHG
ncbi:hypothetical protein THICB1_70095 [Thiomonas arsenitoxydans]|uniref:Uncharacterized protein n=1 Tax=Thiomonas arsenitoxydans (strain DSM 22701 / CIP 110005 / 3As) TaxID=426114 RepID=A0ABM9T858_THIA3|nr:hypothetical protein THICB1_70095 [Thiomonas arsenitoxydans]